MNWNGESLGIVARYSWNLFPPGLLDFQILGLEDWNFWYLNQRLLRISSREFYGSLFLGLGKLEQGLFGI